MSALEILDHSIQWRLGKARSEQIRKDYEEAYLASNRTYEDVLRFTGFTHEEVLAILDNPDDQIPFPDGVTGVKIDNSLIHGKGLFATTSFKKGEVIAPARILDKRTPAGRYSNHSGDPNAEMLTHESGVVAIVALTDIEPGTEVTTDYYWNYVNTRIDVSPKEKMRGKILDLEAVMYAMPEHQIELPVTHHFAPGIYMRELFIPKGTVLTGKIHLTEHLNILSQGHLQVWTEDGIKTLHASTVIKSQPGIKRAGHALENSVWITVHHNPTNEHDVKKLEDMLVVDSYEALLSFIEKKQIEGRN